MLDSHCHLDRFKDPVTVMRTAEARGVFLIAVTNLPSHFVAGLSHVRSFRRVRLALGLHPLAASQHPPELSLFEQLFATTSFVGEVGLDFSKEGRSTGKQQLDTFRFVARLMATSPKFVTLHSRGAESAVLDTLTEFGVSGAIFHWFTGSDAVLGEITMAGHFFSVNPSMTSSANGRRVIEAIPPDRILTESDGPYGRIRGGPCHPWDISVVENYLARFWRKSLDEVRAIVWENFKRVVARLGRGPLEK
jgi:TatD DNase family protein